jgi:hypothetical protein
MTVTLRDPAHYLTALKTTSTPRRLLWLDCATRSSLDRGLWVEQWNGAAIGTTHYTRKNGTRKDETASYVDPLTMWMHVDEFCRRHRQVLWAYDLATQLRVSQGLLRLPELGWKLDKIVLERTAAWARFTEGNRSLVMCDLRSWCPVPFGRLAADVGFADSSAREFTAGNTYPLDVAKWRVGVVRDCVLQILEWLEGENLGQFRPTGSGQSFAAYRRRFMSHRLLVHDDTERLAVERAAMWTGRCEAWRHGTLNNGPYIEYDMQTAYCAIGRDCEVPTVAANTRRIVTVPQAQRAMNTFAVLAHVTVDTDIPCVPTRMAGRTVWPVGRFDTWLWDPELRLAFEYCSHVRINRAYTYHREPALREFCTWVLDGMKPQTQIYGLVPKRVLKHWSRCLVGRMGLRFRAWERFGTQPDPDLRLVTYIDTDECTSTDMLIAGFDRFVLADMTESVDSLPQIPGWIMSECRRRLWEAMLYAGLRNVVYCDTDSVIVQRAGGNGDFTWQFGDLPETWSRKGTYSRMTVHGPRNLVCEDARRVSGLPLTARQVAPLEFTGQVMRSIKESMRAGELDRVTQIPRKFVLDAPDLRRQHLPDGTTAPYEVQPSTPSQDE